MGSVDTARRLLYGAAAGAAVFVAGENAMPEEPKPATPAAEKQTDAEGERYRALLQRLFEQEHPELAAKEVARKREIDKIVAGFPTMEVRGLIHYLDSDYFDVRQASMRELLSRGLAVGEIDPEDRGYSAEQRMRLRVVERNLQVIRDSKRWKGSFFRLPEGWREGDVRSVREILGELRHSGDTGICIKNTPDAILEAPCPVPPDGTPFWQAYGNLWNATNGRIGINTVSAGMLHIGGSSTDDAIASDGALYGELDRKAGNRVGVFLNADGTMQLSAWHCAGARALYPDGTAADLKPDAETGDWSDMLYLKLPDGRPCNIELRLSCAAWPIRTLLVTDFAKEEHQETPDGGLRFLEVREKAVEVTGKPPRKEYVVEALDFRNFEFDPGDEPYCPLTVSGIEAFDAEGNTLEGGYVCTHSESRRTSQTFSERPASVLLRSIDFEGRAVADKVLTFKNIRQAAK